MYRKPVLLLKNTRQWFVFPATVLVVVFVLYGRIDTSSFSVSVPQIASNPPIPVPTPTISPSGINHIDFMSVMPVGFVPGWIWNCVGRDRQGRLYVCIGGDRGSHPDVAVFRYNPATGSKEFLSTLRTVSQSEGNLEKDEPFYKGHSHIIELNGKMYLSTQGFHDITDRPSQSNSCIFSTARTTTALRLFKPSSTITKRSIRPSKSR